MRVILIRHGQTPGNTIHRYVGRTDEGLSALGRAQADALCGLAADRLFVSPMRRCVETAARIFPGMPYTPINDLRECDFGKFEYQTADALKDDPLYRQWIEDGCLGEIPGGEDVRAFRDRCCNAFATCLQGCRAEETVAFVVHGGVIMSIMARYERAQRPFYAYHVQNCERYVCACDTQGGILLTILESPR